MYIEIKNDTLLLIGLLTLILFPQIHLLLIFAIYAIFEEFDKLFEKIIKFAFDYILPLMYLYLLCLCFLKMTIIAYDDFNIHNNIK